ncbi:MAG: prephenate dehydratase [Solirubrobacteraceae bacterium]|jgi:prephenate dehydratase|nr:prephenate dehydratase [Solirubrobacteraceae bacterium]
MRAAFLGPAGTYSHAALAGDPRAAAWEPLPEPTVFDAVLAVEEGRAERAIVPIENSLEGAVGPTLDALATETARVRIVGEVVHPVSHALIGRAPVELADVRVVLSHPQANAQCARFIRAALPNAEVVSVSSTAEAVRMVAEGRAPTEPAAALGTPLAAALHGGVVLRAGVEDGPGNVTRFVWLAPEGTAPMGDAGPSKTSVVWWGDGDEAPGWLVRCLSEFAFRGVNLTRIESRPRRLGLGHYMFFADLAGADADAPVAEAVQALRTQAESVKVLGSYPAAQQG